ncbi:hypothetical protein FOXYSP1_12033 [Fusarium oxysporum f. sp. phaseoli]
MNCAWPIKLDLGIGSSGRLECLAGEVSCVPFFCVLYPVGRKVGTSKCSML